VVVVRARVWLNQRVMCWRAAQFIARRRNSIKRHTSAIAAGIIGSSTAEKSIHTNIIMRMFPATPAYAPQVMECTNDAFMVDAFFKKPEYHVRFTLEDVNSLMNKQNSMFLIAVDPDMAGEDGDGIVGSVHLEYEIESNQKELIGHFSAVSVPSKYGGKGIGKALVTAVEAKLLELARSAYSGSTPVERVISSMGVLNVRPDLFPWYEKQGYRQHLRLPDTDELARIKLDESADVHCILFQKVLPFSK
jgi:GNAT superfamily N-acetyltransferase